MIDIHALLGRMRQIIRTRFARLISRLVGHAALTVEEREALQLSPPSVLEPVVYVIDEAYRAGRLQHEDPAVAAGSPEVFAADLRGAPETQLETLALELARARAAQSLRSQGHALEAEVLRGLTSAAASARGEDVAPVVKKFAARLRTLSGDMQRDWDLFAVTEIHAARAAGLADAARAEYGPDVLVYKRVMPDACSWCRQIYLDGARPRVFKLSELAANGLDNSGRRKAEWAPVIGPTHPHCSCELVIIPPGMTLDAAGRLTRLRKAEPVEAPVERTLPARRPLPVPPRLLLRALHVPAQAEGNVHTGAAGANMMANSPLPAAQTRNDEERKMLEAAAERVVNARKLDPTIFMIESGAKVGVHPVTELDQVLETFLLPSEPSTAIRERAADELRQRELETEARSELLGEKSKAP